jgi:outer membrane lipoprotein SlyB
MNKLLLLLIISMLGLSGCTSVLSGKTYGREDARQMLRVDFGIVEDVRNVMIEGTSGVVGTASGAAIGGIAGAGVGDGRGSAIASIAGAVIGGLIGAATEEGVTTREGVEVTVRLDKSGKLVAVVQELQPGEAFYVGSRVKILDNGREVRVTNLSAAGAARANIVAPRQ